MKRRTHQVQISLSVVKPKGVILTRQWFNSVLHYRAATGEDPEGVTIRAIVWYVNGREHEYEGDKDITDAFNAVFRMGLKPTFRALGKSERESEPVHDDD
jgi:hypothetical protein